MENKNDLLKLKDNLRSILFLLTPYEQAVITMRFGLNENYSKTLEEVSSFYNISVEEIRNIEAKALRYIKHPRRTLQKQIEQRGKQYNAYQESVIKILSSIPSEERDIVYSLYSLAIPGETIKGEEKDKIVCELYKITQEKLDKIKEKVERRISHIPPQI